MFESYYFDLIKLKIILKNTRKLWEMFYKNLRFS